MDPDSAFPRITEEVKENEVVFLFLFFPIKGTHDYIHEGRKRTYIKALSVKVHEILFSVILSGHLALFKMLSKSSCFLKM